MNIYGNSIASDLETILRSSLLKQFQSAIRETYQEALNEFPKEAKEIGEGIKVIPLSLNQPIDLSEKLEYHQNAWDLHVTIEGEDEFKFKKLEECINEFKLYDSENDYGLYSDATDVSFKAGPGLAVLIDTDLAHMALCGQGPVKKLVFKISK